MLVCIDSSSSVLHYKTVTHKVISDAITKRVGAVFIELNLEE